MSETTGYRTGDPGDEQPERPEPAGGAGEIPMSDEAELIFAPLPTVTWQAVPAKRLQAVEAERDQARADLAAARLALERAEQQKYTMQDEARAERDAARQEAATLRAEVTIYWEALTDLIIGAEQQSQSHADVIARASEALVAAKSVTEPGG